MSRDKNFNRMETFYANDYQKINENLLEDYNNLRVELQIKEMEIEKLTMENQSDYNKHDEGDDYHNECNNAARRVTFFLLIFIEIPK